MRYCSNVECRQLISANGLCQFLCHLKKHECRISVFLVVQEFYPGPPTKKIFDIITIFCPSFLDESILDESISPTSSTPRISFITSFGTWAPDDNTKKCDLSCMTNGFKYPHRMHPGCVRQQVLENSWWMVGELLDSPHISRVALWYFARSDEERIWYVK